ncbi:MAG: hypothetical protein KC776_17760 [Myxococcales bacterium]|nr:hypothetical protein [Myxococcales bacterium]
MARVFICAVAVLLFGCSSDEAASNAPSRDAGQDATQSTDAAAEQPDSVSCPVNDGCCCQLDQLTMPICTEGQWTCPPGYEFYSTLDCGKRPGPCWLGPGLLDASDSATDSPINADAADADSSTD